jgi:antitoxin YefM
MDELRQGRADIARGDLHTIDDVAKEMRAKGRLPK